MELSRVCNINTHYYTQDVPLFLQINQRVLTWMTFGSFYAFGVTDTDRDILCLVDPVEVRNFVADLTELGFEPCSNEEYEGSPISAYRLIKDDINWNIIVATSLYCFRARYIAFHVCKHSDIRDKDLRVSIHENVASFLNFPFDAFTRTNSEVPPPIDSQESGSIYPTYFRSTYEFQPQSNILTTEGDPFDVIF